MDDWNLNQAMINSYYVIIRDYDPLLIIDEGIGFFAHNPGEELERFDVEGLLEYFEEEEDYKKCREIKEFIENRW